MSGSGFRAEVLGSKVWVLGLGLGGQDAGFRVQVLELRVWGSRFRIQSSEFGVEGAGLRVEG